MQVFAAEELRKSFWAFVRYRAYDPEDDYSLSNALMEHDEVRIHRSIELQPGDERHEPPGWADAQDLEGRPVVYRTVQEALLDFLIDRIGTNQVPNFPDWLRAQALIMAQVALEPEWLTVRTPLINQEDGSQSPNEIRQHAMTVASGSWDTLSRETFDALIEQFYGQQDRYPLRNREVKRLSE